MNLKEQLFVTIKGNMISMTYCSNCKQYIWPPSYFCNNCFKKTKIKKLKNKGKLIEHTFSNIPNQTSFFGIGDFSGIKIMGSLNTPIEIDKDIMISKITLKDNKLDVVFIEIFKYP